MDSAHGGNGNGRPWWAKTLWVMGPVAVGFLMMLGVLVGWMPSPLVEVKSILMRHVEYDERNNKLLRAICYRLPAPATVANAPPCE